MAKVIFRCDSGANIHSCRKETIDTVSDFGMSEDEWESLNDDQKYSIVEQWANDRLEISWEEIE